MNGPSEKISLKQVTALVHEQLLLFFSFNSFCYHLKPHATSHGYYGADDRLIVTIRGNILNERLVYL